MNVPDTGNLKDKEKSIDEIVKKLRIFDTIMNLVRNIKDKFQAKIRYMINCRTILVR